MKKFNKKDQEYFDATIKLANKILVGMMVRLSIENYSEALSSYTDENGNLDSFQLVVLRNQKTITFCDCGKLTNSAFDPCCSHDCWSEKFEQNKK